VLGRRLSAGFHKITNKLTGAPPKLPGELFFERSGGVVDFDIEVE
jgi:hypothetical protein